jgi:hypothetical protein
VLHLPQHGAQQRSHRLGGRRGCLARHHVLLRWRIPAQAQHVTNWSQQCET